MIYRKVAVVVCSAVLLSGCFGTAPKREPVPVRKPAPVEEAPPASTTRQEGDVRIRAYEPPEQIQFTPQHSPAVVGLLKQAARQEDAGDYTAAVGSVERALRIEPRNAHLWNRLAHLRFIQGRQGLAAELAAKSTALAGGDIALKRDNWRLIAKVRRAAGDTAGARVAERRARMLH